MPPTFIKIPQTPGAPLSLTQLIGQKILSSLLTRIVFFWVPKASPDYDKKGDNVAYWLVEVEDGRAEREIGFNAQREPTLHAPTDRNLGLWTDSDREFAVDEFETVAAVEFERFWAAASQRLPHTFLPATTGSRALLAVGARRR